jgi:hypothetical protein
MYLVDECCDTYVQLESDMVVFQNCDPPRSSNEQVTDGAHKLLCVQP